MLDDSYIPTTFNKTLRFANSTIITRLNTLITFFSNTDLKSIIWPFLFFLSYLSLQGCSENISLSNVFGPGGTYTVFLNWNAVEYNDDNQTPISDLAGYHVYYGRISRFDTNFSGYKYDFFVGNILSCSVNYLTESSWYFSVKAVDFFGYYSEPSNEFSLDIKNL